MNDDSVPNDLPPDWLEYGRWLFAQACDFKIGAVQMDQIPPSDVPEVAFAGRSNVGKSSLINALTGRNTLARTRRAAPSRSTSFCWASGWAWSTCRATDMPRPARPR